MVLQGDRAVYLDVGTCPVDVHTSICGEEVGVYYPDYIYLMMIVLSIQVYVEALEPTRRVPIIAVLDGVPGDNYLYLAVCSVRHPRGFRQPQDTTKYSPDDQRHL